RRVLALLPPLALALVLLAAWFFGTMYAHVDALFLPAPVDVLNSLANGFSSGLYQQSILMTMQESILGFLLALLIALPLGYGLVKSRLLTTIIQPYLAAWQAIPAIVIAPLLVMWLGYGPEPIVVLCTLVVLFPMVISTALGFQTIEREFLEAARLDGAAGWSMLAHIELPLALPAIMAAIRTGLTLSITGAIVGEFVKSGTLGLGTLVVIAKNQYDTPAMFATLAVLAVLAALYYGIAGLLSKLARTVY
ncbi:MAG: ABC transporter permease subunit, partial [Ktedonobacteraceae bacterium]|nr:ABC transporter permease subunit [Ktedonobacteraceae bacterium]